MKPDKGTQHAHRYNVWFESKYKAGDYEGAVKKRTPELLKESPVNTDYANSDYFCGRAKCLGQMGQLTKSYNKQVEYNDQDAIKTMLNRVNMTK